MAVAITHPGHDFSRPPWTPWRTSWPVTGRAPPRYVPPGCRIPVPARSTSTSPPPAPASSQPAPAVSVPGHHRMLVVDEQPRSPSAALDLQIKLWMGQWDALSWSRRHWQPVEGWRPRGARRAHPPPASRRLSGGVRVPEPVLGPTTARLAHHVLTKLDGGVRSTATTCRPDPQQCTLVHRGRCRRGILRPGRRRRSILPEAFGNPVPCVVREWCSS